jgi:hypothetical protein
MCLLELFIDGKILKNFLYHNTFSLWMRMYTIYGIIKDIIRYILKINCIYFKD